MGDVNLAIVGDIYLGDAPAMRLAPEVTRVFGEADLVIANQEGPITTHDTPVGGKCFLRSAPQAAQVLKEWGVDVASLANNHMFDYGWPGFAQTRRELAEAGIRTLGAGETLTEAAEPLKIAVNGTRLGIITCAWERVQTTCATPSSFGCAPLDHDRLLEQVAQLRPEVDALIVLPHWGFCGYRFPFPEQLDLGRRLIAAGATIVAGHHSHVVQGMVRVGGGVLACSLGNFAFAPFTDRGRPVEITRDDREGVILKVRLSGHEVANCELIPVANTGQEIRLDMCARRSAILQRRSAPLSRPDYPRYWRGYVRRRMLRRILYWMNVLHWNRIHRETFSGAWIMLTRALGFGGSTGPQSQAAAQQPPAG